MIDDRDAARIDAIARLASRLGFNEVGVRFKLRRIVERREEAAERARLAFSHVSYEHAVCGHCGRIVPRGTRTCPGCDSRIEPRWVQMLRRAGLHAPVPLSVSTLICVVILLAFIAQVVGAGGAFLGFDAEQLVRRGGHFPSLELATGQYWRLGTAVLLHGGIIHLVFNLLALAQVGPRAEETFGPGRTLFFFVLAGVVANVPSLLMERFSVGIGASGAMLGMAGLAAGWGQREGTTAGRGIRNSMVMWLVYSTLFGLMMNVDHSAHVTGFVTGFALGLAFHGVRSGVGAADATFGLIGLVVLLGLLALVLIAPSPQWMTPWASLRS